MPSSLRAAATATHDSGDSTGDVGLSPASGLNSALTACDTTAATVSAGAVGAAVGVTSAVAVVVGVSATSTVVAVVFGAMVFGAAVFGAVVFEAEPSSAAVLVVVAPWTVTVGVEADVDSDFDDDVGGDDVVALAPASWSVFADCVAVEDFFFGFVTVAVEPAALVVASDAAGVESLDPEAVLVVSFDALSEAVSDALFDAAAPAVVDFVDDWPDPDEDEVVDPELPVVSAAATPCPRKTAAPIPSATANPPTRPTYADAPMGNYLPSRHAPRAASGKTGSRRGRRGSRTKRLLTRTRAGRPGPGPARHRRPDARNATQSLSRR
ncbi:hypothetical protein MMAD_31080 [Mycolicibacterium madagascariense]|uniref:Uncharacterized protein n=1 Tax=Mycolicibacterium madagascariense TaxID=212765 RepID=A0A7I7XI44_9MYCO|nr:hypothetical protein MMAD_31080 [Mycolicibacterium madagascariense]